ncbi:MAG: family 20 glycosylhydrolase, partial [Muribaculaceae bacterium]|nr:family 20 glycosylhydrolase [Muribaculaceae bacterium]
DYIILKSDADSTMTGSNSPEGYRLTVTPEYVEINGASAAGTFYGIQTLRKSLPVDANEAALKPVTITDYPRFPYRGAHLDVCRHFFPVDSVKRFIDMLALHNINTFHWHLTDDQGWRIEIKKYPKLMEIGSMRDSTVIGNSQEYDGTPYGGYYTQEEAKEIVKYAADRHINVIPEVDLPGHMMAALASYPELGCKGEGYQVWCSWGVNNNVLCAGNDASFDFLEGVLDEIIDIFPSKIIHIGGDECTRNEWKVCEKCQARIKAEGIKGDSRHSAEDYLQCYVTNRVEKFVNSRGRSIMGWDEILEGDIQPTAVIHSWRGKGESGWEAAKRGHDVVMSPNYYMYFDFYQTADTKDEPLAIGGCTTVERVYEFDPVPSEANLTEEEAAHVIGVQANMWTEYVPTYSHVEYMELPRMAALAEVQWSDPEKKNYEDFKRRLPQIIKHYNNLGYNYAKHIYNVTVDFENVPEEKAARVTLTTLGDAPIYYTLDGSEPTEADNLYEGPFLINNDCDFRAKAIRKDIESATAADSLRVHKSSFCKITLLQEPDNEFAYAGAPTLVDGMTGGGSYATGRWIGFHGNDAEAVIDFGAPTEISQLTVRVNTRQAFGVFDARAISIYKSDNGKDFTLIAKEEYDAMKPDKEDLIYTHTIKFEPVSTQYVKVLVEAEHSIPDWNGARGLCAYLFLDEIAID